mgnify:CR=1 FL=1
MINLFEARFDYDCWSVEIRNRNGSSQSFHEWFVVALWRAWRRLPSHDISRGS